MVSDSLLSLLACPACSAGVLRPRGDALHCGECSMAFPAPARVPWLFPSPARALADWRNRLAHYLGEFATAIGRVERLLPTVSEPVGRARMNRLIAGYREQIAGVTALLAPLSIPYATCSMELQQGLMVPLPARQDLHSYYHNLHRDWAWGTEENAQALAAVHGALGEDFDRVLVLGAGAGRLSYDLHQASTASLTIALDINPMLALAAHRVCAGETLRLVEFPIAPRTAADVAVARDLRAPRPARPGLEFVLADAWAAPFRPGSFDAVVTPWFVDIVEVDFATIASRVNRLLRPGGRWVNFGSLAFPWSNPALRLTAEELAPALDAAGLRMSSLASIAMPYMRSPASRHSRIEEVVTFAADKHSDVPVLAAVTAEPAWLADPSLPVPAEEGFVVNAAASRVQAVVLGQIDGRRSLRELAATLTTHGLLPPDQALEAVRGMLQRLHDAGRRCP